MNRNPLLPRPGDEALLEKLLSDEAGLRHKLTLLSAMVNSRFVIGRASWECDVLEDVEAAVRVLWNAVKERVEV